jgi:CRP/FNR family transcriptional regulator, anaerobic regulatory protein
MAARRVDGGVTIRCGFVDGAGWATETDRSMVSRASGAAHAPVSHLRAVAPGVPEDVASHRLRQALEAMEALQLMLASDRQAWTAVREHVALLAESHSRLRQLVDRHEAQRALPVSTSSATDFCLFAGLDPDSAPQLERLLSNRIRFRKGEVLYRVGHGVTALYAIRTGSCKIVLLTKDGHDQVAGYHMAGEIIGVDGIGAGVHDYQATALEDSDVFPLPFDQIERLARQSERFRKNLQQLLVDETARNRGLMIILGTMRAEQRLAMFLLDLSHRYRTRGYSPCEFVLRMTRREIGSYLGLKLETVSRLLSRFHRDGLIRVQGRAVKLLDLPAVSRIVDCGR